MNNNLIYLFYHYECCKIKLFKYIIFNRLSIHIQYIGQKMKVIFQKHIFAQTNFLTLYNQIIKIETL